MKSFNFNECFSMKLLKSVLNIFASDYGFTGVRNNPSIFLPKISQFCVCSSLLFMQPFTCKVYDILCRFKEYYYLINDPSYVGFSLLTNTKAPRVVKTHLPCELVP